MSHFRRRTQQAKATGDILESERPSISEIEQHRDGLLRNKLCFDDKVRTRLIDKRENQQHLMLLHLQI